MAQTRGGTGSRRVYLNHDINVRGFPAQGYLGNQEPSNTTNHTTQQTSHKQFIGYKNRSASEWEERPQRLDKGKGFFRGFGACSVSLVGKNCEIGNIVWLLMQSHGSGDFQVSELQVKSGIVCVCVCFPWHRCLESSQCQDVLLLARFPYSNHDRRYQLLHT